MPKLKTHKGLSKVLKKRKSGSIKVVGRAGTNHNTGKKNSNFNRKHRNGKALSSADKARFKKAL